MYASLVRFEWDEAKRKTNIAKHGIDFLDVPEMFGSLMLVGTDSRKGYGETRRSASDSFAAGSWQSPLLNARQI
jgi:hypothetical protein